MTSVLDIRIRSSKWEKAAKEDAAFNSRIQSMSFPAKHEIVSDTIQEQMMINGSVSSLFRSIGFPIHARARVIYLLMHQRDLCNHSARSCLLLLIVSKQCHSACCFDRLHEMILSMNI
jgi:hypothetical protein